MEPARHAQFRGAHVNVATIYAYFAGCDYGHAERLVRAILLACAALNDFSLMGKKGMLEGAHERPLRRTVSTATASPSHASCTSVSGGGPARADERRKLTLYLDR